MTFSNFNTIANTNPLNTNVATPVFTVFAARDPATTDNAYQPATEWQNTVTKEFFKLAVTGQSATWVPISQGPTSAVFSLTGNTGGVVDADGSGNINVLGDGSITTVGSTNTITAQLTGLTNHAVLVGAGTTTITKVGPTATAGQVLQSAGSGADPAFSTATYPATTTINQVLYSSAANTVGGITAANDGVLISSNAGVPSWLANSGTAGFVLTANTGAPPSWQSIGASGALTTLSDDVNATVSPNAGNIQLVGHVVEQGATKFSTIVAGVNLLNINPMSTARWIVDPLGFNGTHTTIASAITSATSGDTIYILPGTYTENLTLKAGVSLAASYASVTIIGTLTYSGAGIVAITGITLQTNGATALLVVSGSSASAVYFVNCFFNVSSNTAITYSSSSVNSVINLFECEGNITGTGIALFTATGAGSMNFVSCSFTNSAPTTTSSTISAGSLFGYATNFGSGIASSGTASVSCEFCSFASTSATAVTIGGTGTNTLVSPYIPNTSGSCLSIGTGATCTVSGGLYVSSNTNAITGAGTLRYSDLSFGGTSSTINTTTTTQLSNGLPFNVSNGGTGDTSFTAYSVICGDTTTTGNLQNVSGVGTTGQVLTSNGASTLPTWQNGASVATITTVNNAASPYTVLATDQYLAVNTSGGVVTLRLPNTTTTGRIFYVKDSNGTAATSNISVTTVGGAVSIDAATTYTMATNYQSINLIFDGTKYQVF